jgi:hypothetical protein
VLYWRSGYSEYEFEKVAHFSPANTVNNRILYGFYNGQQYFIGTNDDRGLSI